MKHLTYTRVSGDTTHTAHVTIGPDGKARVPENQLHHLLIEAGYQPTEPKDNT